MSALLTWVAEQMRATSSQVLDVAGRADRTFITCTSTIYGAMLGALEVAAGLDEGLIVMIFPDFGDRYLSTNVWLDLRDGRPGRP